MHDADALQTINAEQLATATDRWLLRASRGTWRPPSLSLQAALASLAAAAAATAEPTTVHTPRPPRGWHPRLVPSMRVASRTAMLH